jgi:Domain of unknown function DUF29
MPDSLYERDVLAWSQHQADLLRRLGQGERVNDVDWANVAEEIEDVGLSELHSAEGFLTLILAHLLKLYAWPQNDAGNHWRGEVVGFQAEAGRRFSPSMRQRIDVAALYAVAVKQIRATDRSVDVPADSPFTLDELLTEDGDVLLNRLQAGA